MFFLTLQFLNTFRNIICGTWSEKIMQYKLQTSFQEVSPYGRTHIQFGDTYPSIIRFKFRKVGRCDAWTGCTQYSCPSPCNIAQWRAFFWSTIVWIIGLAWFSKWTYGVPVNLSRPLVPKLGFFLRRWELKLMTLLVLTYPKREMIYILAQHTLG